MWVDGPGDTEVEAMGEAGVVIEIPQAAYLAGALALNGYLSDDRTSMDAAGDVIHAAAPLVVAAELVNLADQLTELAESMRNAPQWKYNTIDRADGLDEGITVIRERAAQLLAGAEAGR